MNQLQLGNIIFPLECPLCHQPIDKPLGWTERDTQLTCSWCRGVITLSFDDNVRTALDDIDQALSNLGKSMG